MSAKFTIKQIFKDNWESFLTANTSLNVRDVVKDEVAKTIDCGDEKAGCSLYFCSHCQTFKYVPFRCKSRFCATCGQIYKKSRAIKIASKLTNCTHRHIVFTIPEELRVFFQRDRNLLNILFKASSQTLLDWFYSANKSQDFKPGIISTLHTFGRDLKWNPHIHMLVTEGAVGKFTTWRHFKHIPYIMLRRKWQATLLFLLSKAKIPDFKQLKNLLFKNHKDGFYVYAKPNSLSKKQTVNYIIRYVGRPVMAQSRILAYDGDTVTFWYERHEDHKRVEETIPAFEFIKRLIIHIPNKYFNMVRYYGYYAKEYHSSKKLYPMHSKQYLQVHSTLNKWRFNILESFNYDPIKCKCGHKMELVNIIYPCKYANVYT
jgi:hypothetical protein